MHVDYATSCDCLISFVNTGNTSCHGMDPKVELDATRIWSLESAIVGKEKDNLI